MSDSSKINFSQPSIKTDTNAAKQAAKINPETSTTKENNLAKQVQMDNRSVFNKPSLAQEQLSQNKNTKEARDKEFTQRSNSSSETGLKIDYQIQSKNPLVAAQLQNPNKQIQQNQKNKKAPPEQRSSSKSQAINPRKVKPSIPGRLQASFDINQKPLERLNQALDVLSISGQTNKSQTKVVSDLSFSELLNFGIELLDLDIDAIIEELKTQNIENNPELAEALKQIINELANANTDEERLLSLLKLYSPIPFPYLIQEVDSFFEEDEDELKGRKKKQRKNPEDSQEEENNDDEGEFDSQISMSVTTLNFNKIHFLIKHSSINNSMLLEVIGDPIGMELLIPIETNLETEIVDQLGSFNQVLKTWHDNVLRITDTRILKLKSTGRLDPILQKACANILQTINQSDIDLSNDDIIDSSYKLL